MQYPSKSPKSFPALGLTLLFAVFLGSCRDDKEKVNFAVSPGEYTRTPLLCGGSGEEPRYPNHNRKALFGGFDNLTEWDVLLSPGQQPMEVLTSTSCKLTIQRSIFTNENGFFSFNLVKTHQFDPEGCQLTVTVDGETLPVDPASPLFADTGEGFEDLRFAVSIADGGGYILETLDQEPINRAWQAYGCASSDTIRFQLGAKKPN